MATKQEKQAPVPKAGERTKAPKELALQLHIDPKALRRFMREQWGTHYQRWAITPAMEREIRKHFVKRTPRVTTK
jgi:hypothetical protein